MFKVNSRSTICYYDKTAARKWSILFETCILILICSNICHGSQNLGEETYSDGFKSRNNGSLNINKQKVESDLKYTSQNQNVDMNREMHSHRNQTWKNHLRSMKPDIISGLEPLISISLAEGLGGSGQRVVESDVNAICRSVRCSHSEFVERWNATGHCQQRIQCGRCEPDTILSSNLCPTMALPNNQYIVYSANVNWGTRKLDLLVEANERAEEPINLAPDESKKDTEDEEEEYGYIQKYDVTKQWKDVSDDIEETTAQKSKIDGSAIQDFKVPPSFVSVQGKMNTRNNHDSGGYETDDEEDAERDKTPSKPSQENGKKESQQTVNLTRHYLKYQGIAELAIDENGTIADSALQKCEIDHDGNVRLLVKLVVRWKRNKTAISYIQNWANNLDLGSFFEQPNMISANNNTNTNRMMAGMSNPPSTFQHFTSISNHQYTESPMAAMELSIKGKKVQDDDEDENDQEDDTENGETKKGKISGFVGAVKNKAMNLFKRSNKYKDDEEPQIEKIKQHTTYVKTENTTPARTITSDAAKSFWSPSKFTIHATTDNGDPNARCRGTLQWTGRLDEYQVHIYEMETALPKSVDNSTLINSISKFFKIQYLCQGHHGCWIGDDHYDICAQITCLIESDDIHTEKYKYQMTNSQESHQSVHHIGSHEDRNKPTAEILNENPSSKSIPAEAAADYQTISTLILAIIILIQLLGHI